MITRPSCYATAGRDAKIDWKALSKRIGHADVAFTMKQYVQTDLEADRQVANTLAELIIGGTLASTAVASLANPLANHMQKALSLFEKVRRPGVHARLVTCVPGPGDSACGHGSTRPRPPQEDAGQDGA